MLESLFQPLFDRTGSAHDAAALVTPNAHWTYGRLGAEILRFLTLLRDLPDGTMLIHGHKEPEAVAAMLAAIWMGRAYVFADAANPASRMDSIARTASAWSCPGKVESLLRQQRGSGGFHEHTQTAESYGRVQA
jgi:D-alanine--poly(phosphoribitol) ligase subunit 1